MPRKSVLVLGAGMVGSEIARCLSQSFCVVTADRDPNALDKLRDIPNVQVTKIDFTDQYAIQNLAYTFDVIVGAMPGFLAFNTLRGLIQPNRKIVDISFFEEDPFALHELAMHNGATVVVDFGLAPGMSNFFLGHENSKMQVDSFVCQSGGLPVNPPEPWRYKAPFEVRSVIDMCLRPARLKRNGQVVTLPPLSEPQIVNTPLGELEGMNIDGLRTLFRTMPDTPNMVDRVLRYPGYRAKLLAFKDSGFFADELIDIEGAKISPLALSSHLLSKSWKLDADDNEFTFMEIVIAGIRDGAHTTVRYELVAMRDRVTGASSMARTTGYPCAAIVHLLAESKITENGIITPEELGAQDDIYQFVINFQNERGVHYTKSVTKDS